VTTYRAGTYLRCEACGRMLRIDWPTRSIVCSCGQRLGPTGRSQAPGPPEKPPAPKA
jgi:DNA-directed RNA polymerase subunit RPC12/RpoP